MSRPTHRWNALIRSYDSPAQDNGESLNAVRNKIVILATPTLLLANKEGRILRKTICQTLKTQSWQNEPDTGQRR